MRKINIFGFVLMLLLLSSIVFAGDVTQEYGKIDFNIDSNDIAFKDYKITSKVIAVNSSGYTFTKEKIEYMGTETTCIKTQSVTNETTGIKETICIEYEEKPKVIKEEWIVATLEFNECTNGKWYRIYKHNDYVTDPNKIINEGYIVDDILCEDNKLSFQVDSFSSYTTEEIDYLLADLLAYYGLENSSDYEGNYDLENQNSVNFTNAGVVGNSASMQSSTKQQLNTTNYLGGGTNGYTIAYWIKVNALPISGYHGGGVAFGGGLTPFVTIKTEMNTFGGSEFNAIRIRNALTDSHNLANKMTINTGQWYHLTHTSNTTTAKFYIDGVEVNSSATDILNGGGGTSTMKYFSIGRSYYSGDDLDKRYSDADYDEVAIYERELNSSEVERLYTINTEGFNPYNYTPVVEEKDYTAMYHITNNIINDTAFVVSGSDFVLLENFTFNLTNDEDLVLKLFGYADATLPEVNTLYIRIKNNETLFNSSIVTIPAQNERYRQFNLAPLLYSASAGENNIEIYVREEGNGVVNLYNLDLVIDTEETTTGIIENKVVENVVNITSTDYVEVNSFITPKDEDEGLWVEVSFKVENLDLTYTKVDCVFRDYDNTTDLSEILSRSLQGEGVGSFGSSIYFNQSVTNATAKLFCSNTNGNNVQVSSTAYTSKLKDSVDYHINGYDANLSGGINVTGLTMLGSYTHNNTGGQGITSQFGLGFNSVSGEQITGATPIFIINTSSGCEKRYLRSLTDNDDFAGVKGNIHCEQAINTTQDIEVWVDVDAGETIQFNSIYLAGYETIDLDITTSPTPISNIITTPENDSSQDQTITITQIVNDLDNRGWISTIYLRDTNNTLVGTLLSEAVKLNTTSANLDISSYPQGDYIIEWYVDDGVFNSSDSVYITYEFFDLVGQWEFNECPSDIPTAITFISLLFFFIIVIIFCEFVKWNVLGIFSGFFLAIFGLWFIGCWVWGSIFLIVLGFMIALYFLKNMIKKD